MAERIARRTLTLSTASPVFQSPDLALPAKTDELVLRLKRPTTLEPGSWLASATLSIALVFVADGIEHRFTGQASGGIRRASGSTQELTHYVLKARPTWGFFGARSGRPRRLGEGTTSYTVRVEVALIAGSLVETEIEASSTEADAPDVPFHSSVAFDAATDVSEAGGDGVVSLNHTASGSDRGVFAGVAAGDDASPGSTSVTYAGSGLVETWESAHNTFFTNAGYHGTQMHVPTGSQSVVSTLTGANEHALGVISMTGVHQGNPVGTPSSLDTSTADPDTLSVTVGSVGSDDLVVDNVFGEYATINPGADQTTRNSEVAVGTFHDFRQSTQLGSAGGVMSWSISGARIGGTGIGMRAVAFKPSVPPVGVPIAWTTA